ncbi:MAG: PAS domain S-box protein [Planctomycetaceae bacterium]|nr:PAS domain S-box protein [Planctomycetaceae bacterium]
MTEKVIRKPPPKSKPADEGYPKLGREMPLSERLSDLRSKAQQSEPNSDRSLETQLQSFRDLIDQMPLLLCVRDANGPILINRTFEQLTGYGLPEVPVNGLSGLCISARDEAGAQADDKWRIVTVQTKHNATMDIASTAWRLTDGLIAEIGLDARNHIKAQTELKEYAARLKDQTELIDLSHDSIIIHDLDGKVTFWNQGSEQLYGWKRQEIIGKIIHQVLHTEFCEPLGRIIAAVSSSGKWEGELINTAKDGKVLTLESRWALRKGSDGKPIAILEIDRDISRRKENEQIAREALEYAESIIETVSEALVVLTPELKVASANERFYRMFGFTPEDILNRPLHRLGNFQWDIPELRQLLSEILPRHSSIEEYVMEYQSFYTGRKTLHLNARQISPQHRNTRLILLAIQDITARRRQEEMLKEMTEQLLLSEEEQRQQIATSLHDTIGQVLACCKRDLRAMEQNTDGTFRDALHKVVNSINEAIEQSRKLTVDLSSPTLHTFGLEAGIEEMTERFTEMYGLRCKFLCSEEPKPLEKKVQLLLYRSVRELLLNAAKHASAEKVTVQIGRWKDAIRITVEDDGCGFDTACLYDPAMIEKGVGLYSISQRLKNIGGTFSIQSKIGSGTTILLDAPLHAEGRQGDTTHDY